MYPDTSCSSGTHVAGQQVSWCTRGFIVDLVNSGPTYDVSGQTAGWIDVMKESGNSRTSDDIIEASPAAKRKLAQTAHGGDLQATKRHLETMLQLETHARRTMEENFQRVKGFSFAILVSLSRYWSGSDFFHRRRKLLKSGRAKKFPPFLPSFLTPLPLNPPPILPIQCPPLTYFSLPFQPQSGPLKPC